MNIRIQYIILVFVSILYSNTSKAQLYEGSNGDGFDVEALPSRTLTNLSLAILYEGSNGDGFALRNLLATTLNNTSLTVMYDGSNGDGFAIRNLLATTLNNTSLAVMYDGSNGDGFALRNLLARTLNNTSLAVMYDGSNGDGFALRNLLSRTLNNTSLAVMYDGSNGDGFDLESLNATTLNNISLAILFEGGNGDGFDVEQENVFLDPSQVVDLALNIKVLLQGPSITPSTPNLMNDNLRTSGYIPTTSPYSDLAFINANVLNNGGNTGTGLNADDIVDWVWIEIRNGTDVTNIINSKSALLQRDGDVVGLDGVSNVTLEGLTNNYYVVVKHRNHLGVMTNSALNLTSAPTTIDFSNSATPTFGQFAQTQLSPGIMALWSGDVNNDGRIRFSGANNDANSIKDIILAAPENGFNSVTFELSGYLNEDVNFNGSAKFSGSNNDSNVIKDNILSHPANGFGAPTFTINSTVPDGN